MTIKGLWPYLQNQVVECLYWIMQSSFRGYRVSIDTASFSFRLMMSARAMVVQNWNPMSGRLNQDAINNIFYRLFMQELINLLIRGITPIFVFEYGKHPLKTKENEKRTLERMRSLERIEQLYEELEKDAFSRTNEKKIQELKSLEKNLKSFPPEIKEGTFELLVNLGIPCLQGKDGVEAERIASILCMCDVSAAVYSRDGDCLAHGAPIQIKELGPPIYEDGVGHETFVVVDREMLLASLELTSEEFKELCICAGCDYNTNIPKVGFVGSLKHIRKYGSIANFPDSINRECLRYEECLPEFGMADVSELLSDDCLEFYNVKDWDSFSDLVVKVPEQIGGIFSSMSLERYEEQYRQKASNLPVPENYIHRQVSDSCTTVQINFPEDGQPYVNTNKKR